MSEIVSMQSVEPILYGVLKITWDDGYAGLIDLRPILADGEIFAFLRDEPKLFSEVKLEEYGHYIYWLNDEADEVEFGSESLRKRAERQIEILRLAS